MASNGKLTRRECLIALLLHQGYFEVAGSRTTKYVELESSTDGSHAYIGKSGALRTGRSVASSMPATDRFREAAIVAGRELIERGTVSITRVQSIVDAARPRARRVA